MEYKPEDWIIEGGTCNRFKDVFYTTRKPGYIEMRHKELDIAIRLETNNEGQLNTKNKIIKIIKTL